MIKLLLMSKLVTKKDGNKFRKFFTRCKITVKGEEEKGKQLKTLNIRFDAEVKTKDFVRGYLTVEDNNIDMPYQWQIKKDEKTGKDTYPYIYIKKVENYEEAKSKSTIEFVLTDEDETEEVNIDDDIDDLDETPNSN